MLYLFDRQITGIDLINGLHHLIKVGETLFSAVVLINNPCAGRCDPALAFILALQLITLKFTGVMIKPESAAFYKRNICQAVIFIDLDQTILKILRMHKFPMVDHTRFQEQSAASQTIKIRSRDQSHCHRRYPLASSGSYANILQYFPPHDKMHFLLVFQSILLCILLRILRIRSLAG